MFVSLSKMLAKVGGVRLGFGLRITKKNAAWMWLVLLFVLVFQMMWYMLVLCFWILYAICYGVVYCIKALIGKMKGK